MTDADSRPSPDALLKEAGQAGHGRLKIFLGAAPGVGKTYEMLVQARRRKLEGVDAVIGVVETHGRVETDLLTKGIEIVPKKRIPYKGRVLAEMDLDAILQRRPRLVLVDELAHDNAPASRHPKRYHGRGGDAGGRHRRLYHPECAAHRKPERCGGQDHPCAGARDGAGFHSGSRR